MKKKKKIYETYKCYIIKINKKFGKKITMLCEIYFAQRKNKFVIRVYNRMYDKKKKNIFRRFCAIIIRYSRTSTSKTEKNKKNFDNLYISRNLNIN